MKPPRYFNHLFVVIAMCSMAASGNAQESGAPSGPHGSLGVFALTTPGGVTIMDVAPGGNAERAGLKGGDIIRAIDGTPIRNLNDFGIRIVATPPGTVVRLSLLRAGAPKEVRVTVESDADRRGEPIPPPAGSATPRPTTGSAADQRYGPNLPERPIPAGFSFLPDARGSGRVLLGSFTGNARSATVIVQGVLASLRDYFDGTPVIHTAARNDADRQVQALFSAAIQSVPVVGVIGVSLSSNGGGTIAVLFDRAGSFRDSYIRLRGRATPLHPVSLADGSVISIPDGWRITSSAKGAVDVAGPSGEALALGAATPVQLRVPSYVPANTVFSGPCCDPVTAMTVLTPQVSAVMQKAGMPSVQLLRVDKGDVQNTPAPMNGKAAFIFANLSIGGRPTQSFSWVAAVPTGYEQWVYYISSVAAPSELFASEASTLLAIWKSYSINPQVFAQRMDDAVKNMNKATESILSAGRESARVREAAAENWDQVIRGVDTVENTRTGRRYEVDNQSAQRLVDGLNGTGSGQWKVVGIDELVPRR